MCIECGFSKCSSSCPNADSPRIVEVCDVCGENVEVYEEYYDFNGDIVCQSCLDDYIDGFKRIVEED